MARRATTGGKAGKARPRNTKSRQTGHRGSPSALQAELPKRSHELAELRKQLAESLEQQTATSEVLRVISSCKWLLAAEKANALWDKAIKDPSFKKQVDRLTVDYIPQFSIVATVLLSYLEKNLASFVVHMYEEMEGEVFTMMVEMGFFVRTGQRYQMVIPTRLTMGKVKRAALTLAQTEDEEYWLHPENLVATMPYAEAKAWQARLRGMDEDHRCADRLLLLETSSDSDYRRERARGSWVSNARPKLSVARRTRQP